MHPDLRARWATAALFLANGIVPGCLAPQIPLLLPRHDITEATLGLVLLALGIGAVGAMLFSGRLIALFGLRPVLTAFALALVPTLPAVVLAPSLPLLALAMAFLGAVAGCMDVAMNAQAVEVERRLGRAIMSSLHGFWSLGGFAAAGASGWVIATWGAPAHAFAAAFVLGAITLAALPFIPASAPAARSGERGTARLLPRDPALWFLGLISLMAMVPEGAVLDWGALYIRDDLGAGLAASGLAYSFFAGAMALFRFMGDGIRNRLGAVRTLRLSALIGCAGLAGAAAAPSAPVAIAAFGIAGVGVANVIPVIFSAAGNHPGLPSGAAIAFVTMLGYSGILLAPASIGFAVDAIGFRVTFALLGFVLLLVALNSARASAAERGTPAALPA